MDWQTTLCISWAIPARSCTFTLIYHDGLTVKKPFRCPASSQVEVDHCTERWPCYSQHLLCVVSFVVDSFWVLLKSFSIVVIPARKYTDQNWARDHKSCLQHLATVLLLLHLLFQAASISVSTIGLGDVAAPMPLRPASMGCALLEVSRQGTLFPPNSWGWCHIALHLVLGSHCRPLGWEASSDRLL